MKPHRIILTADQSAQLDATEAAFVVIAKGSYPDATGRIVLHLVPTSIDLADKAVKVARGELGTRRLPKR